MAVARITQIIGASPHSWEDAVRNALHRANKTLRGITGSDEQLVTLVSRLFAQPLKRSRPLWELHQIDGYREERSVIFAKVHHCMIDGVSGVQLLGVMFDPSPTPAPVPPPEGRREAPALPTPTLQLLRAVRDGVQGGLARVHAVVDLVRNPGRGLAELGHAADAVAE